MSDSVLMPALGESVTEGTVTRWLKQVGDTIAVDEPLLEVSTDKVDTEIPSPVAGTLLEILVPEDETVEVGTELARIGSEQEGGAAPQGDAPQEEQPAQQSDQPQEAAQADQPQQGEQAEQGGEQASEGAAGAAEQQAAQVPQEVTSESSEQPAASGQGGQASSDAQDVTMPALGESVTEGTVTRWLKQVGDEVAVDEPLLEVSTDKVDTEIPSPVAGTLQEILVQEDETVEVGTVLARVGSGATGQAGGDQGGQQAAPQQGSTQEQGGQEQGGQQASGQEQSEQQSGGDAQQASTQTTAVPEEPAQQEQPVSAPQPSAEASSAQAPGQVPAQDGSGQEGSGQGGSGQQSAPVAAQQGSAPQPDKAASRSTGGDSSGGGGYLTPLVRKLAAEKGVDLSSLTGTGVGGRIRKEDVLEAAAAAERAAAEREAARQAEASKVPAVQGSQAATASARQATPAVSPLRGTTEKASRLRQIIAERMVDALHSMAQLTTVIEVDVTKVARLRARAKDDFAAREGVKLTFLPFFVLAATEALKAHPKVNGVLEGKEITYHGQENVGIAVDTERGLVVPVIRDAGDLNLAGIARKINDLATRTRENKATPDDLSGATFTVTNTGSSGALFDTPIVPGGTSAILGTGAIVKRPVVAKDEDGQEYVAIRSMCYLALSYDHRLVDGADASRYLMAVKKRIEEGDFEAELGL